MSTVASNETEANQLWGIYYTDREYAREMGDPLRTVVEAHSKQEAEDTARRYGFSEPWANPVTEQQARHLKVSNAGHSHSEIPTAAELHTAIQVLEKLTSRLDTHAKHSLEELPANQLGNQYATQIKSNLTQQTERIKLVGTDLKNWQDELLQQRQTPSYHV
jgi:hypothetical protein